MRKPKVSFLLLLLFVSFLLPHTRMAQGERPPECCPLGPTGLDESDATIIIQGQFVMSDQVLQSQGITRGQYVDQLAAALFPNKQVDLVLPSTDMLSFVRIDMNELQTLDEVGLTDGVWYIAIRFVP